MADPINTIKDNSKDNTESMMGSDVTIPILLRFGHRYRVHQLQSYFEEYNYSEVWGFDDDRFGFGQSDYGFDMEPEFIKYNIYLPEDEGKISFRDARYIEDNQLILDTTNETLSLI